MCNVDEAYRSGASQEAASLNYGSGGDASCYLAPKPEVALAKALKDDLNIDVNPQALRMFLRTRWSRVSALAHKIHGDA